MGIFFCKREEKETKSKRCDTKTSKQKLCKEWVFIAFHFIILFFLFFIELLNSQHSTISWSLAKLFILLCSIPHPHPTPVYILQSHCIFVALYFLQLLYTLQSYCILCSTVPTVTLHFTDLVHPLQHRTFHSYHTHYRSNASIATLYLKCLLHPLQSYGTFYTATALLTDLSASYPFCAWHLSTTSYSSKVEVTCTTALLYRKGCK